MEFSEQHIQPISFFSEAIEFSLDNDSEVMNWIKATIMAEGKSLNLITFVFCSDDYLLEINKQYLQHDYYTDIISFPYSEDQIEGDIYISIDRVRENAKSYTVPFSQELLRVIIHGVLHFAGYGDKSEEEALRMRSKEDHYLSLYPS